MQIYLNSNGEAIDGCINEKDIPYHMRWQHFGNTTNFGRDRKQSTRGSLYNGNTKCFCQ